MIKTLTIDGKEVTFKSTGGTLIRYRNQFNSEMLTDISKLEQSKDDISSFTIMPLLQIIWTLAKTADDAIPDMQTWYDSFEDFPIIDVWTEIKELVAASLKSLYPKNPAAAGAKAQNQ